MEKAVKNKLLLTYSLHIKLMSGQKCLGPEVDKMFYRKHSVIIEEIRQGRREKGQKALLSGNKILGAINK